MILRRTCPVCDRSLPDDPGQSARVFPFCSVRCRQIDLFRWAEGRYAIVEPLDPEVAELLTMDPDAGIDSDGIS